MKKICQSDLMSLNQAFPRGICCLFFVNFYTWNDFALFFVLCIILQLVKNASFINTPSVYVFSKWAWAWSGAIFWTDKYLIGNPMWKAVLMIDEWGSLMQPVRKLQVCSGRPWCCHLWTGPSCLGNSAQF